MDMPLPADKDQFNAPWVHHGARRDAARQGIHWLGWLGAVPTLVMAALVVTYGFGQTNFYVDGSYLLHKFSASLAHAWADPGARNTGIAATNVFLAATVVSHAAYACLFWLFTHPETRLTRRRALSLLVFLVALPLICRLDLAYWTTIAAAILLAQRAALGSLAILLAGCWTVRALELFVFHVNSSTSPTLANMVLMSFMLAASYGIGRLIARERQTRLELSVANAQLRSNQVLLERSSRAAERLRIARDLHDDLGHHLTALRLHLELASRRQQPPDESVAIARDLSALVLEHVREIVAGEREDADFDLESALAALCDAMPLPEHRLQVDPRVAKLPAAHLQTLFRLAQEALTNCAKHSRAKLVTLSIHVEERAVIATIEDDGIGMQGAKAGNGLRGLEERVSLLAGTMTLSSHGAGGCRLVVTLPLKDPRDAGRDNG